MGKADVSIGTDHAGKKLYMIDGYAHPQVMHGDLRIIRSDNSGMRLQQRRTGAARGECTQTYWVDIPVYNEQEEFIGYLG